MKARSATLNDAMLGSMYAVAGVAMTIVSFGQGQSFDAFALTLAAAMFGAVILLVAISARQLRRAQTLTQDVVLLPWYSVVMRAALSTSVPLAAVVYISTVSGSVAWVLGPECLLLGLGMCGIAAVAARRERRSTAQIVKTDHGYFLAPQTRGAV